LKRHAQRQVPAPFARTSVTQHFSALPTAGMSDAHRTVVPEDEMVPRRRERPRLRPAIHSYPRCQRSRRAPDDIGRPPVYPEKLAKPPNSPNSAALSPHRRWWS